MRWAVCLLVLLLFATATANAAEYFASSSGSSTGSGAIGSPWDLQTALNEGYPADTVQPGDTIWLRGGTYTGAFTSNLNGTAASPIKVRQYAGERATLVGTMTGERTALYIHGAYTWFMNFEVTSAGTDRISTQSTPWPTDIDYAGGVITGNFTGEGVGCKLINMVIHDTAQGLSLWLNAVDFETNGCIIYHNGWDAPDRGHGHGIYTQNNTGVKSFKNNIVWAGFSYGTQAYGSEVAYLNNFTFEGNTYFDAGIDSNVAGGGNLLVGGGSPCHNIVVTNNAFYRRGLGIGGGPGDAVILGYGATNVDGTVTDNYCGGYISFKHWQQLTVRRNTVVQDNKIAILDIRPLDPQPAYDWNDNTYYCLESAWRPFAYQTNAGYYDQSWAQWKAATGLDSITSYTVALPTSVVAFVRPSAYDSARASITVYNWPQTDSVAVDVSSFLNTGDTYELRDAQNFYGTAVATGAYVGGTISIPMTSTAAAQPTGNAPLPYTHTPKQFGCFIIRRMSSAFSILRQQGGGPQEILIVSGASGDVFALGDFLASSLDLAERFTTGERVEAGDVVVMNPRRAQEVILCRKAYDFAVAGIIATKPGMLLGADVEGQAPVALAGRVPCKADASYGAIDVGDLLTTSPTPGHAMKADPEKIVPGCVIGKALEPLDAGRGTIKVIVTLQ